MSLTVPSLDDRTYADLLEEGLQLIPQHAPEWTDHNASDPGITLIELFAFLAETDVYRVDRTSEASKRKYLQLIVGRAAAHDATGAIDAEIQQAVAAMRQPYRAVSGEDFERFARAATDGAGTPIAAARCFERLNLAAATDEERRRERLGHLSVVFVPADPWSDEEERVSLRERIATYLEPRRLLTTRVHVVAASYVDLGVRVHVDAAGSLTTGEIERSIRQETVRFLDPLRGGPDGAGYPLGKTLYAFDLHRWLGRVPGLPRLHAVTVDGPAGQLVRGRESGEAVGVQLRPWESPRLRPADVSVTLVGARGAW